MTHFRRAVLTLVAVSLCGCAAMEGAGKTTRSFVNSLKPVSWDDDNPADDPGDPWIEAAGLEGRAEEKRENVMDPLGLRQYTMSPKARAIERNMGFDD